MIKSILQSLPIYVMSCLRPLKVVCNQLTVNITKFQWNKNPTNENKRAVNWQKWNFFCQHKWEGELGFRDLISFNKVLLAKQAWKLVHEEDGFFASYFKNLYFPQSFFLSIGLWKNVSEIWRSLAWANQIIQVGQGWRVGDGSLVNIWEDNWLTGYPYFKPFASISRQPTLSSVLQFINSNKTWNVIIIIINSVIFLCLIDI